MEVVTDEEAAESKSNRYDNVLLRERIILVGPPGCKKHLLANCLHFANSKRERGQPEVSLHSYKLPRELEKGFKENPKKYALAAAWSYVTQYSEDERGYAKELKYRKRWEKAHSSRARGCLRKNPNRRDANAYDEDDLTLIMSAMKIATPNATASAEKMMTKKKKKKNDDEEEDTTAGIEIFTNSAAGLYAQLQMWYVREYLGIEDLLDLRKFLYRSPTQYPHDVGNASQRKGEKTKYGDASKRLGGFYAKDDEEGEERDEEEGYATVSKVCFLNVASGSAHKVLSSTESKGDLHTGDADYVEGVNDCLFNHYVMRGGKQYDMVVLDQSELQVRPMFESPKEGSQEHARFYEKLLETVRSKQKADLSVITRKEYEEAKKNQSFYSRSYDVEYTKHVKDCLLDVAHKVLNLKLQGNKLDPSVQRLSPATVSVIKILESLKENPKAKACFRMKHFTRKEQAPQDQYRRANNMGIEMYTQEVKYMVLWHLSLGHQVHLIRD